MASRKERNTIDQKKRNFTLGIVEEGVAHKVQDFHLASLHHCQLLSSIMVNISRAAELSSYFAPFSSPSRPVFAIQTLNSQSSFQQAHNIADLALISLALHSLPNDIFSITIGTVILCLTIAFLCYEKRRSNLRVQDFDGPRGLPIIGNLFHLKRNIGVAAERYRGWSQRYGDVFQVQLGDIPVLVVNSASAAKAIFSGHSGALSSRPTFYTFHAVSAPSQLMSNN
jgi:hypothetical protein